MFAVPITRLGVPEDRLTRLDRRAADIYHVFRCAIAQRSEDESRHIDLVNREALRQRSRRQPPVTCQDHMTQHFEMTAQLQRSRRGVRGAVQ